MGKNLVIKNPDGVKQIYNNIDSIVLKDTDNNDVEFVEQASLKMTGKYHCMCIDYDGTVLKEEWLDNGDTFRMPTPPEHKRLLFQEWSCSQELDENNSTIVSDNGIMAGPTYASKSGLTEFDIELTKVTGLTVTIKGTLEKDWGDGVTSNETSHTYSHYGKYTIKADFSNTTDYLFGQSISTKNYTCTNIIVGNNVKIIEAQCFAGCMNLKSIILPNNIESIGSSAFSSCNELRSIVIPKGITSLSSICDTCYNLRSIVIPNGVTELYNTFNVCYNITDVIIPNSVTILSSYVFQSCYNLADIIIPNSVNSLINVIFGSCYNLRSIVMSKNVTSLPAIFRQCYNLLICDFSQLEFVPKLDGKFQLLNDLTKIYVPDSLYDEWITATNWVTYADYIYKASEMEGQHD